MRPDLVTLWLSEVLDRMPKVSRSGDDALAARLDDRMARIFVWPGAAAVDLAGDDE